MTADAADAAAGEGRRTRRRLRRVWCVALVFLLLLIVAATIVWSQRRQIAGDFVNRELARRGVSARYTVDDIGLSRQRLTNVVIGDPRRPDLVADWIDVTTDMGLTGPVVSSIAVGHVRIRARLAGGQVSLGEIDKLLPPPSGKPFQLPALNVDIHDGRMRLATPQGVVGLRLSGSGALNDGFSGRLAAVSEKLSAGGCTIDRFAAATALRVSGERPSLEGPVRAANLACGDFRAGGVAADVVVTLGAALDRWTGRVRIASGDVRAAGAAARQVVGRISFDGSASATGGSVDLKVGDLSGDPGHVDVASLTGRYRIGAGGAAFNGRGGVQRGDATPAVSAALSGLHGAGRGTPVGPIVDRLVGASKAAARDFSGTMAIEAIVQGDSRAIRVSSLGLSSASGTTVGLSGDRLRFGSVEVGGRLSIGGGGLPEGTIDLRRDGRALAGSATFAPYAAGTARLALTPIAFRAEGDGVTTITAAATLSGPLGDGRVDALRVPVAARWAGTRLAVNPGCTAIDWQRVAVSGLMLDPARLRLCATGPALVALDRGRLAGGAGIVAPRLSGRLGDTPLTLAATGAELRLGGSDFTLAGVAARLGAADRLTRIDAARLAGRIADGGVAGRFEGAGGRIGNVPLLLSDAAGDWRLKDGVLTLGGALQVADAAPDPRFKPLAGKDVALKLADGRITATGVLTAPRTGAKVADVTIEHLLSSGSGEAALVVPGLAFASDGLQPDDLTPLTFGVIADVQGTIAGRGDIAWTAQGVSSTGRFRTDGTDLAAAFGPVSGIKGEIAFTDLLGLVSAPNQVATIAQVNPGIAVENGTVRYQLVGDSRVQVNGGQWPFAGGDLSLEPTLLDFDERQHRRMTFRVTGGDAAQFLQQFDFDNLNATGTFDGELPMIFDEAGGRIENGRLSARAGGSIAYIGTVSEKNLGTWGNLAFQALKALDYRNLNIMLNGPLAGEMVTEIRFAGVSQGKGTKSNFLIRRLARLPFVFNVTVRAPFRQLVDSARSYYDPSRLIQRNLPALLEERRRREQQAPPSPGISPANRPSAFPPPIQPSESEKRP